MHETRTRSPRTIVVTALPTSTTVPTASWPRIVPGRDGDAIGAGTEMDAGFTADLAATTRARAESGGHGRDRHAPRRPCFRIPPRSAERSAASCGFSAAGERVRTDVPFYADVDDRAMPTQTQPRLCKLQYA